MKSHRAPRDVPRSQAVVQVAVEHDQSAPDGSPATKPSAPADAHARVELALTETQRMLAITEASLAASRAEEKKARRAAMHDSATGLPNRELFDDRLAQAIALAARHDWTLAVMFLDLDGFKRVNDEHGHAAGDLVLKEVASRLRGSCRQEDTVCRTGGDEFLFLLMNPRGRKNIQRVAEIVSRRATQPIDATGARLVVGVSIGIAVYPSDASTGGELIAKADEAMYRAKRASSSTAFFASADPHASY